MTTPITGETWGDEKERGRTFMVSEAEKPLAELMAIADATRNELVAAVTGLSEAQARFRPGKGGPDDEASFSIIEVARHITNVEPVMAGRLHALAVGEEPPAGLGPGALGGNEDAPVAKLVEMMTANRDQLRAAVLEVDGQERLDYTAAHRHFGELNVRSWLRLHALHEADHVHQVAKIKAHPEYPKG